mgnify:CR=1 FL=1|tara:strand:- start:1019 stop:1687 length:669 start_codon:yes stop_codon:yes gene_type:complete
MDPVDDLVYSKRLRKPSGEITLFKEDVRFIRLPQPTPNSSLETGKELLTIQGATYLRGMGMEKSIRKHDRDPAFAVRMYMDLFGLDYDNQYIDKLMDESTIVIRTIKNSFNRPRPFQLAPYFGIEIEPLKSRNNKTPSYPSGHTTQSRLIAEVYAAKYPEHRKNLIKASEECGGGRIMAGFHYPTDHKAGIYLAKRLFGLLKSQSSIKYDQSIDLTTSKGRK